MRETETDGEGARVPPRGRPDWTESRAAWLALLERLRARGRGSAKRPPEMLSRDEVGVVIPRYGETLDPLG